MFDTLTGAYQVFKIWLLSVADLSHDALHMHFGLGILVIVRLLWRGRSGWLLAWCTVLGFAVIGEIFDWRAEQLVGGTVPPGAHWHDLWNTMIWPTVLAITGWRLIPSAKSPALSEDAEQPLEQA
jgi:hypothetical protein